MDVATSEHPGETRSVHSTIQKPQAAGYLTTYESLRVRLFLLHVRLVSSGVHLVGISQVCMHLPGVRLAGMHLPGVHLLDISRRVSRRRASLRHVSLRRASLRCACRRHLAGMHLSGVHLLGILQVCIS